MLYQYDDSTHIHQENVTLYANTNEAFLDGSVKGIILEFPGLGGGSCLGGSMEMGTYDGEYARRFAADGILLAYLFPGPWSWGTRAVVRIAEGVIRALAEQYGLTGDFPLLVCGGSMGGQGSLMFAAETKRKLCGVAAACPVTDTEACFSVRPEFARTFLSAVAAYDMPLTEAIKAISPICRVNDMPDTAYYICSDSADELLPEEQCDAYAAALQARGLKVQYRQQPGMGHGGFLPEVREEMHCFMRQRILG